MIVSDIIFRNFKVEVVLWAVSVALGYRLGILSSLVVSQYMKPEVVVVSEVKPTKVNGQPDTHDKRRSWFIPVSAA